MRTRSSYWRRQSPRREPTVSQCLLTLTSYLFTPFLSTYQKHSNRSTQKANRKAERDSFEEGSQMAVLLIARPIIVAQFARVSLMK